MVVFTASATKVVGFGFLCGLVGSWLLTSSTSSYLSQIQLYSTLSRLKEDALDVQDFGDHGGHHEGSSFTQILHYIIKLGILPLFFY